jgi:hypothetical protein
MVAQTVGLRSVGRTCRFTEIRLFTDESRSQNLYKPKVIKRKNRADRIRESLAKVFCGVQAIERSLVSRTPCPRCVVMF